MAGEVLEQLGEHLKCTICLDTLTDPKILQCFHVYCQQCLVALRVRDQHRNGLSCPTCRQVTAVPDGGVAGLHPAFHINHLLELQRSATKSARKPVGFCPKHAEEKLKLYCETCEEPVCLKCAIRGGGHQNHEYINLDLGFAKVRQEITSSLEPMKEHVKVMKEALEQLDKCCGKISDQQGTLKSKIRGNFRHLRELLDTRETALIGQLNQMTESKLKRLTVQREEIETNLVQYNSYLHYVGESLLADKEGDVVTIKTENIRQVVKELTSQFQPDALKPITNADIEFLASDNASFCWDYGQLLALGLPDLSRCHTMGKGLKSAIVGKTSNIALKFEGTPSKEPTKMLECLECNFVSEVTGARLNNWKVDKRKPSLYGISYMPNVKGRHQLYVTVEGQHIKGSPFSIVVKAPVEELGTPILNIGRVTRPVGIAINKKGEVLIAGTGRGCISKCSSGGENLQVLLWSGSGQGECRNPQGLALDSLGNILVADSSNHRIQKFTSKGQFLASVGTMGSGPLQFLNPTNIVFNASNKRLYVVDSGNHRVQVLNFNLSFYESFGRIGNNKGQFSEPCGVACDSTGKVYVADSGNHRIQVFTAEGKFLRMFGRCGQGRGDLYLPSYITIGSDEIQSQSDIVYISEMGVHRVSVFTSEGHFVTSFGRRGEGPGKFDFPCGLAVDDSGILYVCDSVNNCIQVF